MNQGAARHALKDRGPDLYETPAAATRALLRVESFPPRIWEPAAGRGAISRVFEAAGHDVIKADLNAYHGADAGIEAGRDFLMEWHAPPGCEVIVTNPPFKLADAFIRHGLTLAPRVVVFQRLMALEGVGRSDLVDGHLRRVWAGKERLPMVHRDGWTGPRLNTSALPYAWFVFDAEPRAAGVPVALQRMSWRTA
jgi:hypothetical protein